MSDTSILVVGSLNVDSSVRVPHLPAPGETVLADELSTFAGGKGANQAIAAARLGARVAMVGAVGADAGGQFLRSTLSAEGIDVQLVREDPEAPTGQAFVFLDDEAENNIVVVPGANHQVSPAVVADATALLQSARVVVLQLEIPLPAVQSAASAARGTVILNPAPAQALPPELLAATDVLVVNETEFRTIIGADPDGEVDQLTKLLGRDGVPDTVIVTRGGGGNLLWHEGDVMPIPVPPVRLVDTTGAGDTFVGALAAELAADEDMVQAARIATVAASLSVQTRGATPGMPTRQDLDRFLPHAAAVWSSPTTTCRGAHQ